MAGGKGEERRGGEGRGREEEKEGRAQKYFVLEAPLVARTCRRGAVLSDSLARSAQSIHLRRRCTAQ